MHEIFSYSVQLCGNRLAVHILGLGSFSANFCPMFIAFVQPEIQSAINGSLSTPTHQRKVLGTLNP